MFQAPRGDAIRSARFAAAQTQTLLASLARNLCLPLNTSDLARDLDVSQSTATDRLTDLADHFLTWPCYREQGNRARPSARRKWYFVDPILARLASLRPAGGPEPDLTKLSQQQVGVALLRNVGTAETASLADFDAVLYHRTAADTEIDFVSGRFPQVAIESKYLDSTWGRELNTMTRARRFAILASRSSVDFRENAVVVPAPILALVLGG